MSVDELFFIFWATPIIITVLYYFLSLSKSTKNFGETRNYVDNLTKIGYTHWQSFIRHFRQKPTRPLIINTIILSIFLIFLGFYISLILYAENFGGVDEHQLIRSTLKGNFYPPPIWVPAHRFWPLGHQEFNIISKLTRSPEGYHAFPILQLLCVIVGIFAILKKFPVWFCTSVTIFTLTRVSFVIPFFGLIFPERNIIFWLVIFLICFQRFSQTGSRFFFCCTLIATQFILYYKEPIFLMIGGFVSFRLLLGFFIKRDLRKQNGYNQFFRYYLLEILLLTLVGLFLVGFYLFIFLDPDPNSVSYAQQRSIGIFPTLKYYLRNDRLLNIFLFTIIFRWIYLILFRKIPNQLWDSLAFGVFLYFLSFIQLQITSSYYLAPVDFIAILYVSQVLYYPLFRKRKIGLVITISLIFLTFTARNTFASLHSIASRKNEMLSLEQLSSFLKNYIKNNPSTHLNLFFPSGHQNKNRIDYAGFNIYEIGVFLEYRGLMISREKYPNPNESVKLILKRPNLDPKNLCFSASNVKCFYAKAPQSGDLIIVTPRPGISKKKLDKLKQETTLLFHYKSPFSSFFEISDTFRLSDTYIFREP